MSMSETFSLLYFNKTLLHKSSEQSSLVSGPGLNSPPPEAKNPSVFQQQPFMRMGEGAISGLELSGYYQEPLTRKG